MPRWTKYFSSNIFFFIAKSNGKFKVLILCDSSCISVSLTFICICMSFKLYLISQKRLYMERKIKIHLILIFICKVSAYNQRYNQNLKLSIPVITVINKHNSYTIRFISTVTVICTCTKWQADVSRIYRRKLPLHSSLILHPPTYKDFVHVCRYPCSQKACLPWILISEKKRRI